MWLRRSRDEQAIDISLFTDDLILRPARMDDYKQWHRVRSRNKDYLTPFEPAWPDNCLTQAFYGRRVARLNQEWMADRCYAFVVLTRDGELIGGMNINNVARGASQSASLGYWISQEHQGKGWMTQAGTAVLDFAFSEITLARMNAATLPHNHRSRNLLRGLGFVEEGFAKAYIQINGVREDHVLYGLNAEDFLGTAR